MPDPRLDWNTAEVSGAKLKVALDGETPPAWRNTFERTIELLGSGDWDRVKLKKHSVQVNGVTHGSEEKLRHYLESIVLQANTACAAGGDGGRGEGEDEQGAAESSESTADAEMAERFRSFASTPPPKASPP